MFCIGAVGKKYKINMWSLWGDRGEAKNEIKVLSIRSDGVDFEFNAKTFLDEMHEAPKAGQKFKLFAAHEFLPPCLKHAAHSIGLLIMLSWNGV